MAHFHGSLASIKVSTDEGKTWTDIGKYIIGPLYLEDESGKFVTIYPDNPLYGELVEILENPLPYVRW